ncbi:hypothetical protein [Dactylosporangium darangshiense]|uniref:Lipoprotein LpqB beta-propeller domain-containing protein n=1 Tax=Dactylosporangium darangshiense TaxID=579108 RepID=A0ABP8DNW1_9ACTN
MPGERRATAIRTIAMVVALLVGGWLVVSGPPRPGRSAPAQLVLRQAWPGAAVSDTPGSLPDGAPFVPALYLDATTSVGVAPTPDGTAQRVVLRAGDRVRELQRVEQARFPRFAGFTRAGDDLVWAESTATATQPLTHRLWRASRAGDAAAVPLTADTGDAELLGAEHDLVVHDGRVYWAATAPDGTDTQVRSVAVSGGPVTVTPVDGAYELSAWPWLQTATNVRQGGGRQELRNLDTGQRITIVRSPAETVDCGPAWCRSIVSAGTGGDTGYDVLRPDGTGRRRVGGVGTFPAVPEVALLDRFEAVTQAGTRDAFDASRRLALVDLTTGRLVTVADGVDQVMARDHTLWWSTGARPAAAWHSLDLSTLAP